MKTYPILFSTEMVQAILDERKRQTRRICKHQHWSHSELVDVNSNGITQKVDRGVSCPYGEVGDVLWVREEHLITFSEDRKWIDVEFKDGLKVRYYYKDLSLNLLNRLYKRKSIGKWQRARFLPKELARIYLEITNIEVDRLNQISHVDSYLEGVISLSDEAEGYLYFDYMNNRYNLSSIESFRSLWQSINGVDSWDENPWVWVIEFKRIDKPENY